VALDRVVAETRLQHGLAELVGYLSLREPGLDVVFDDDGRVHVSWPGGAGDSGEDDGGHDEIERVADIPRVTFARSDGGSP
jgi:hypothetical protein